MKINLAFDALTKIAPAEAIRMLLGFLRLIFFYCCVIGIVIIERKILDVWKHGGIQCNFAY
jgi:hypothetical protein